MATMGLIFLVFKKKKIIFLIIIFLLKFFLELNITLEKERSIKKQYLNLDLKKKLIY